MVLQLQLYKCQQWVPQSTLWTHVILSIPREYTRARRKVRERPSTV